MCKFPRLITRLKISRVKLLNIPKCMGFKKTNKLELINRQLKIQICISLARLQYFTLLQE